MARASNTTLQSAAGATGDGTAINMNGATRLVVEVSGTFSGTVSFEGTIDDTTWFAVGLKTAADGAAVTTTTAPGVWKMTPDMVLSQFRARVSAWASGAITAKARKQL